MTDEVQPRTGLSRRTVLTGAAWSVPIVAAAVATPLAAASTATPSVAWTATSTSLATLQLLDGGGTITASALLTQPTQFTLTNGSTPLVGEVVTVEVRVDRPAGINIPVGRARGFGVYSLNGTTTTPAERTATYQTAPIVGQFGLPVTTWTGTRPLTVAAGGTLTIPVVFGLAGVSTGVAVSALASFPVILNIVIGGATYTATSLITVPVGAGIL